MGIVGGGQLARMLALSAHRLGLQVFVLSERADDPAAQVVRHWTQGSYQDPKTLLEFADQVDTLTFESEVVDVSCLEDKAQDIHIFPSPQALGLIRDRLSQKKLLEQFAIPTAPFKDVGSLEDLRRATQLCTPLVLKKRLGGYDGYGTYFVHKPQDLKKYSSLFPDSFIAEQMIPFQRELAVLFVRSSDGSFLRSPLVETHQQDRRCDIVIGPKRHRKLEFITKKFRKMMSHLDYVGVLAVEMFDTNGDLLVNELAPRVHNTAHYTEMALTHSQFDLHLLAGFGASLRSVGTLIQPFGMANLIGSGETDIQLPTDLVGRPHWYGKMQSRKGRKMGHLSYHLKTEKQILDMARKERKKFKI